MNHLSRFSLAILILFAAGIQEASAQARRDSAEIEKRMAAQVDAIVEHLALSEEQEAPVRAILADANKQRMELRMNARQEGGPQALREKVRTINEATKTKLGEILTDEQMAAYSKFIEESRDRRQRQ